MNESTAKRNAALWVGAVFVLGAALGGVFGYFFGHRGTVVAGGPPAPPLSEPVRRAKRLDQFTRELSLSDAQRQQMDTLLLQGHNEAQSVRDKNAKQLATEMDEVRQKTREQMRAILTPEQKPKFEDFLRRLDEERRKNGLTPVPPPPQGAPPSSH